MDISLNARIYLDIKEKISNGTYGEETLLPTELQLQEEYGVSRAPVRQALGRLENDGLIVRKAGKGTYVANRNLWRTAQMTGFRTEFLRKAERIVCKTLYVEEVRPNGNLKTQFELKPREKLLKIVRIRIIAGQTYQYLEHYVKRSKDDLFTEVGDVEDMIKFLEEHGVFCYSVQEEIEAVTIPAKIATEVGIKANTPVLKINRYSYDRDNKLREFIAYYTVSDMWKYRVKYEK